MSEKFKKLLATLMAYEVPFRFQPSAEPNSGAWIFGYTAEDGEEISIWEADDIPSHEDVLFLAIQ